MKADGKDFNDMEVAQGASGNMTDHWNTFIEGIKYFNLNQLIEEKVLTI